MQDLISILGYRDDSPFKSNPYLDIYTPNGVIDMSQTSMDLIGIDNKGNKKKMKAGRKNPYRFEGDIVREIPTTPRFQKGGINFIQQDNLRQLPIFEQRLAYDNPKSKEEINAIRASQQANMQTFKNKELARRKALIDKSNTEGGFKNSAIAEKMRLFPNDATGWGEVVDDYINPLKWVGSMADDIGHSKNAADLLKNAAVPVAFGVLNGLVPKSAPRPYSSQEVLSTSSGMDAVYAKQPGYNSHLFNKPGYVPPTTDPNLAAYVKKDIPEMYGADAIRNHPLYDETVRKSIAQELNNTQQYRDIRDMVKDGESWKLSKQDLLSYDNLRKLEYFKTNQNIALEKLVNLQKLKPDGVLADGIPKFSSVIQDQPNFLRNSYGEFINLEDRQYYNSFNNTPHPDVPYTSNFNNYKTNPKLNTYDKALNAAAQDAGKAFEADYRPTTYKEAQFQRTGKNKLGGNIYAKKGLSLEQMFNYIFDDKEEDVKCAPTAPTTEDVKSQYDIAQEEFAAQGQRNQDDYNAAMAMVTNSDYQNPNRQLYLYGEQPSGFQQFGSYQEGRQALEHQLELYQTGKTRNPVGPQSSILDAMSVYAPSSDNNNPYTYAATISKHLGVPITTPISQIDRKKWADVIEKVEGNKKGNNPGNLRIYKK